MRELKDYIALLDTELDRFGDYEINSEIKKELLDMIDTLCNAEIENYREGSC